MFVLSIMDRNGRSPASSKECMGYEDPPYEIVPRNVEQPPIPKNLLELAPNNKKGLLV